MKNLNTAVVPVVLFVLLFGAGEYFYSVSAELYRFFGWLLLLAVSMTLFMLLREYSKPISSALRDSSTGLPNSALFCENLDQAITYAERNAQKLYLVHISLDDIESINGKYGNSSAQKLLFETAVRLREGLRASDIIARLSESEFIVLLRDIEEEKYFYELVDKLTASIEQPAFIDENALNASISINTCSYPENGLSVNELMQSITA